MKLTKPTLRTSLDISALKKLLELVRVIKTLMLCQKNIPLRNCWLVFVILKTNVSICLNFVLILKNYLTRIVLNFLVMKQFQTKIPQLMVDVNDSRHFILAMSSIRDHFEKSNNLTLNVNSKLLVDKP